MKSALVFLCLLLIFPPAAAPSEVRLTDIAVTNNRDDLLLFLQVKGAFTEDMVKAIQNGIPTTFSFFIRLEKKRSFWFDKTIATRRITHTIKYNSLKDRYMVKRSWKDSKPVTTGSFEQAKALMSGVQSLRVTSLANLEKNRHYRIKAKAELDKITLPFNLHYIFFFFTALWDFETSWHTFAFQY
ncbi:MAG: DUF4390 domain-containing protein [Desulfosalsimonadaceae bacterium]